MQPILTMLGLDPDEVKENLTGFVDSLRFLASSIEENNKMLTYLVQRERRREDLEEKLRMKNAV